MPPATPEPLTTPGAAISTTLDAPRLLLIEPAPALPPQTDGAGTIALTALHLPPSIVEPGILLPVPYRSQLDGTVYARANCGPASLAMILDAHGIRVPTRMIRDEANRRQRSYGYDDGVAAEVLKAIGEKYGLQVFDLFDRSGYKVWSPDDLRTHIEAGRPVITLVKYRTLPGNASSRSEADHYIVLTGLSGRNFIFNDPAFVSSLGYGRLISPDNLIEAWDRSIIPRQALALGPSLPIEPINGLDDIRRLLPLTATTASGLGPGSAEAAELATTPIPGADASLLGNELDFPRVERRPRPTWTPTAMPAGAGGDDVGGAAEAPEGDAEATAAVRGTKRVGGAARVVTILRMVAEWLQLAMRDIDGLFGHEPINGW